MGEKVLEMTIEELNLSARPYNALKRARIDTVRKLIERTEDDLLRVRNLGRKSLDEVIQKLALLDLHLREPSPSIAIEYDWDEYDSIEEYDDNYDGVIDWEDNESYFESSSCSDVDSLSTILNCEFSEVCSQDENHKKYKFRFMDGMIEVYALNEQEAKILAKAEAIKRGWNCWIIKSNITYLKDIYIDWDKFDSFEEEVQFRELFAKARSGDIFEVEIDD